MLEENNSGFYNSDNKLDKCMASKRNKLLSTRAPSNTTTARSKPVFPEPRLSEPEMTKPTTPAVNIEARSGGDNTHIVVDDAETVVQIGKSKKVSVRKAKFNQMGVTNIVKKGQQKMIEQNVPQRQFHCKCRLERESKMLQKELNNYLSSMDGTPKLE